MRQPDSDSAASESKTGRPIPVTAENRLVLGVAVEEKVLVPKPKVDDDEGWQRWHDRDPKRSGDILREPHLTEKQATALLILAEHQPEGVALSEEEWRRIGSDSYGTYFGVQVLRGSVRHAIEQHVRIIRKDPRGYRIHPDDRPRAVRVALAYGARQRRDDETT